MKGSRYFQAQKHQGGELKNSSEGCRKGGKKKILEGSESAPHWEGRRSEEGHAKRKKEGEECGEKPDYKYVLWDRTKSQQ